jgi:hypothetical protein
LVNFDEDILKDVFGGGVVADAGADEGANPVGEGFPDVFEGGGH